VLEAIADPERFDEHWISALLALPDKELPELDQAFADQLNGRGSWVSFQLICRYATAAILPEVTARFESAKGRWACSLQTAMLAYFLRVDEPYGVQALTDSLASRATGCWRTLFTEVSAKIWTPGLEMAAIGALNQDDPEVPREAALALQRQGSEAAKKELIKALEQEYRGNPIANAGAPAPDAYRRAALVNALLSGHGWVLTPAELTEVEKFAIDPDLVDRCKQAAQAKEIILNLSLQESGNPSLILGSESYDSLVGLEKKVSLYPAGTTFKVGGTEGDPLREEFMVWAKEKKLVLK
jgi:hypothetical protein